MIRHVVLFDFKPSFTDEIRAAWTEGLDRLEGNVPGLVRLSHGPDVLGLERSFDHAIVADFESVEDIAVYDTHPLHEAIKPYSLPNAERVVSVDFVL